jgi:protein-L-isoaspartate(D-aspartate) O-methyltransferase
MAALAAAPARAQVDAPFDEQRRMMIADIAQLAAALGHGVPAKLDPRVMAVMAETPRDLFVPEAVRHRAYVDNALEIGHGATISQPFMVALMTHLLQVGPGHKVLEVGTGSGYQAAVLSRLAEQVFTIEIVEPLAAQAAERLKRMGYANVAVRAGDGYAGWPEQAPFDRIMVTAGATRVPRPLVAQLARGGRMLVPVGASTATQRLTLVERSATGKLSTTPLIRVAFVPLVETGARKRGPEKRGPEWRGAEPRK